MTSNDPILALTVCALAILTFLWAAALRRRARPRRWEDKDALERAAELREAMKAIREAEIPRDARSWQRMTSDPGVAIGEAGGNCPVQIQLEVDGHSAYFRARGTHWSFQVAQPDHFAPCEDRHALFKIVRLYSEEPFSAGYMTMTEAADLLEGAISEFRQWRTEGACTGA